LTLKPKWEYQQFCFWKKKQKKKNNGCNILYTFRFHTRFVINVVQIRSFERFYAGAIMKIKKNSCKNYSLVCSIVVFRSMESACIAKK
jgi:hypothetical protein